MTGGPPGRPAQRRRTRQAIVDATAQLLSAGADPSVTDIAAAADVSRRTIYTYFPTLDQLLLDATLGALSGNVEAEIAATDAAPGPGGGEQTPPGGGEQTRPGGGEQTPLDPLTRAERILDAVFRSTAETLPLGRRLIRLTVDSPPAAPGPRRGYRRVQWIEAAVAPWRDALGPGRFEDLVSSLTMLSGWEGFIVLTDIRGLDPGQARAVSVGAAMTLIRAATSDAGTGVTSRG